MIIINESLTIEEFDLFVKKKFPKLEKQKNPVGSILSRYTSMHLNEYEKTVKSSKLRVYLSVNLNYFEDGTAWYSSDLSFFASKSDYHTVSDFKKVREIAEPGMTLFLNNSKRFSNKIRAKDIDDNQNDYYKCAIVFEVRNLRELESFIKLHKIVEKTFYDIASRKNIHSRGKRL